MFRRVDTLARKNLGIILLVVLGFLAWNSGLLVISNMVVTDYQWQGLPWKTASNGGKLMPTLYNEDTVNLAADCSGAGCQPYGESYMVLELWNNFDLSKYSEVRILTRSSAGASVGGNSMSASTNIVVDVGGVNAYALNADAREGGGTYVPSQSKSESMVTILKKEGNTWAIYQNEFKIGTVNNVNPKLLFRVQASATQDSASASATMQVNVQLKGSFTSLAPQAPAPPSLSSFISAIVAWIGKILDTIPFLTIAGSQSPSLGTTQTYTVSLTAPYAIDDQYADGTYSTRYCNVALVNSKGDVLSEAGFVSCADTYSATFTTAVPKTSGKYAVIAVMTETKGVYDAGTALWTFAPYEIIAKDALDITTKAPIPGASSIPLPSSANIFAKIWTWLFGWLF